MTAKTAFIPAVWGLIGTAVDSAVKDDMVTRAAALAFFTVLSLSPLIVLILYATTLLGLDARAAMVEQLQAVVGERAASAVGQMVGSASIDPKMGRVSVGLSLLVFAVTATAVFTQLQNALNHIWGATSRPPSFPFGLLRRRAVSLAMITVLGVLLVVSLMANFVVHTFLDVDGTFALVATKLISGALVAIAFTLLYRLVPDAIVAWRDAVVGGIVTAVLFEAGKYGIGAWLGRSGMGSSYGAAGSLVILFLWIYYSAIVVLFGAELTEAWSNAFGSGIVSKEFPERKRRADARAAGRDG